MNQIEYLSNWLDETLWGNTNIKKIEKQVSEGMKNINKTCLPGKFIAWSISSIFFSITLDATPLTGIDV